MVALSVAVDRDLDRSFTVVAFAGELSLATTPLVRAALLRCLAECPFTVVADVDNLRVSDRSALAVFGAAHHHQRHGPAVALALCAASTTATGRAVRRILGHQLPVYPSRSAALAAALDGQLAAKRIRVRLSADPQSAGTARRLIAAMCATWGLADLADAALLVVSELVSNAVLHAGTDFDLTATVRGAYLHLSVRDGSRVPPLMPVPAGAGRPALASGGRGLYLVDSCTAGWGSMVADDGKVVWATLRTGWAG
jgi:anti-sigma regulatory factor (Ser/Thr protein kinase)/anti-anti-sigma regulatory factor